VSKDKEFWTEYRNLVWPQSAHSTGAIIIPQSKGLLCIGNSFFICKICSTRFSEWEINWWCQIQTMTQVGGASHKWTRFIDLRTMIQPNYTIITHERRDTWTTSLRLALLYCHCLLGKIDIMQVLLRVDDSTKSRYYKVLSA